MYPYQTFLNAYECWHNLGVNALILMGDVTKTEYFLTI